jgi:hypothetical protein
MLASTGGHKPTHDLRSSCRLPNFHTTALENMLLTEHLDVNQLDGCGRCPCQFAGQSGNCTFGW